MIFQTVTDSFKTELLRGVHDFVSDTFKIALYTSDASLDAGTTIYSATNEVTGSGYTAGGLELVNSIGVGINNHVAYVDFHDVTFSAVTLTALGALIYNWTINNRSVCVLDFGLSLSRSGTDLVIKFPVANETTAIIRI